MKPIPEINLTEKQVETIAEDVDCGLSVLYNLEKKEIISLPPNELGYDMIDETVEQWEEIEQNWGDYLEIKKMDSRDSFIVMEEFTNTIEDDKFKIRLIRTLERSKPFRNFKFEIDNNWDYREKWFDFKKQKMIEWVNKQIQEFK